MVESVEVGFRLLDVATQSRSGVSRLIGNLGALVAVLAEEIAKASSTYGRFAQSPLCERSRRVALGLAVLPVEFREVVAGVVGLVFVVIIVVERLERLVNVLLTRSNVLFPLLFIACLGSFAGSSLGH